MDEFPSWFYGPNGEADVFQSAEEVPEGWLNHPSKHPPKDGSELDL